MPQKISDSFDDLYFDDWGSLLSQNKFPTFNSRFDSGKMHNGFDSQNIHNSHNKFDALEQAEKGLIFQRDIFFWQPTPEQSWSVPGDAFSHPQLYKHMVCKKFDWRTYTTAQALPTTKQVKLFHAKEFAMTALVNHDKALWLGLRGQNCLCHNPRRVLRLPQCLSFRLYGGATQAY